MSNRVPDGWSLQPLSVLANYHNGRAFKPEDWSFEGLPIIRIAQINNRNADLDYYAGDDVAEKNRIRNGDLLFSWSATLTALIWDRGDAVLNQHIFKVEEKSDVDRSFLHQLILSSIESLAEYSHGSTMKHIKKGVLDEYCVEIPPLPEQQKIATILSSVDNVIEKTRAQIDKLKDLKTGMMQELLTKGIGLDGVPHTEFKDSPLGWIPADWDVGVLESLEVSVLDGDRGKEYPKETDFHTLEYCLFLSAKNVTKSGFSFSDLSFITKEKDAVLRKGKLSRGDIVITTRGTVGNISYYDASVPYENIRINSGMAIIRNKSSEMDTRFLNILMNSPLVGEQIKLLTFGSAQPQLTIGIIKELQIPKPCLQEQEAITTALESVSSRLKLANQKQLALNTLKKALMQDLLTGKVRVKIEDNEKEPAVA